MPVISSSRLQTVWAQIQSGGSRIINNSSGTWTSTGARKQRYDSFNITRSNPLLTPSYKTGTRSPLVGYRGRQGATFDYSAPLIPSGALGVVPDSDPILQSIFGAPATVVSSTSVTYNLGDALYNLFMAQFNKTPGQSPATHQYVLGGVPTSFRITGGGNKELSFSIQGAAVGQGDNLNFAAFTGADAVVKGGLTSYPTEPGSATQNGNVIPGFLQGAGFSFGGSTLSEARGTIEIVGDMGVTVIDDTISDPYTYGVVGGLRQFSISRIQCVDTDGTVLQALKQASFTKTPTPASIVFGNVAGSIVTINLANVQVGAGSWSENGAALDITFDKSDAHATSSSVSDDITMVLT